MTAPGSRPPYPSPLQRALLLPLFRALRAYFRASARGLEGLPRDRPVLLVAKHPRGYLYFETMLLGLFTFFTDRSWPEIQVMEKRDTSLHATPLIGWLRRNVNTIPATEAAALEALAAGRSVLVFPGGARELFGEPDVLSWSGRRGFARVAARAGVPVVPLAIAGADRQHPWRLRLGRSNTLWLPPLPLPVRLDYWFGTPMAPPDPERPELVAAFADEVAAATQALLDEAVGAARGASAAARRRALAGR
ncbi:MAG TPA: 1-acyl-sn-glycerol-3-phosphate acyltransferase [Anaeromyxobacteraceae bacterium]|nr:1-acyl-sn-glycerol-3-phosphate acyltransferase [Anaeromyxobacteraceae bacterium]